MKHPTLLSPVLTRMAWLLVSAALGGCGDTAGSDGPAGPADAAPADASATGGATDVGTDGGTDGAVTDAGQPGDAGVTADTEPADASAIADGGGLPDAGPAPSDADPDAAPPADAEAPDVDLLDDGSGDVPGDLDTLGPAPDTGEPDAATWPPNPVAGQCKSSSDCASQDCNTAAPGGICLGCNCGPGYECNFGACNAECGSDTECPPGLVCKQSAGVCVSVQCTGDADCFGPYVCTSGLCSRPQCEGGACPAPLVCQGVWCVEP